MARAETMAAKATARAAEHHVSVAQAVAVAENQAAVHATMQANEARQETHSVAMMVADEANARHSAIVNELRSEMSVQHHGILAKLESQANIRHEQKCQETMARCEFLEQKLHQ